jgi:hypothetical protein
MRMPRQKTPAEKEAENAEKEASEAPAPQAG